MSEEDRERRAACLVRLVFDVLLPLGVLDLLALAALVLRAGYRADGLLCLSLITQLAMVWTAHHWPLF